MRLLLMRHAKAEQGHNDIERRLTDSGVNDAKRIAEFLRMNEIRIKTIWQSDRKRSQDTAQIISTAMPDCQCIEQPDLGPDSPISSVRKRIEQLDEDIMIVGHQPMLGQLAAKLVVGDKSPNLCRFKTADLICLEKYNSSDWQIAWVVNAKMFKPLISL